jgi:uncharacterized membrane protein
LILIASVLWTFSISLLKLGLQGINPVMANGIRLPVSCLFLIPLAFGRKPTGLSSKPAVREIFLGALSGALSFGLGGFYFFCPSSMPERAKRPCSPAAPPSSAFPYRPFS